MKRTTVRLNERILKDAKTYAAQQGQSLTSIIEEALADKLYKAESKTKKVPIVLPVFKGGGLQPGIDLDKTADLLDILDEDETW